MRHIGPTIEQTVELTLPVEVEARRANNYTSLPYKRNHGKRTDTKKITTPSKQETASEVTDEP